MPEDDEGWDGDPREVIKTGPSLKLSAQRLASKSRAELIAEFGRSADDTGSTEVQIALLSKRIAHLTEHLKEHKQDHHSRRGLMLLVGQRRRLLNYLAKSDIDRYRTLIYQLGLRR